MSLTRRLFLRHGATAAAATAVTAPAVAAPVAQGKKGTSGLIQEVDGPQPVAEDFYARADRLAWELADALNNYDRGRWYAQIYPSLPHDYPVGFFRIDGADPERMVDYHARELAKAMKAMGHDVERYYVSPDGSFAMVSPGLKRGAFLTGTTEASPCAS
jgi:hypothetical protein